MAKKLKKEITLNNIADKIDGMDKRFDGMDKRFGNVEKSIEDLAAITKKEFEKVDARFDKINIRFENVDRSLEEIKMKFAYTAWAIDLKSLEKRVKTLEDKTKN